MVQHGCLWKSCQAGGPPREAEKAGAFQEAWHLAFFFLESLRRVAAVHGNVGSGNKRRFRGSQPHHSGSNFLR